MLLPNSDRVTNNRKAQEHWVSIHGPTVSKDPIQTVDLTQCPGSAQDLGNLPLLLPCLPANPSRLSSHLISPPPHQRGLFCALQLRQHTFHFPAEVLRGQCFPGKAPDKATLDAPVSTLLLLLWHKLDAFKHRDSFLNFIASNASNYGKSLVKIKTVKFSQTLYTRHCTTVFFNTRETGMFRVLSEEINCTIIRVCHLTTKLVS